MSIRHNHNGRQIIQSLSLLGASIVLIEYGWRSRGSNVLAIDLIRILDQDQHEIREANADRIPWIGKYFESSAGQGKWREKEEFTAIGLEDAIHSWSLSILNKFHPATLSRVNRSGRGRVAWRLPVIPPAVRDVSRINSIFAMMNEACFTAQDETDSESARKLVQIPISMEGIVGVPSAATPLSMDVVRI